MGYWHPGELILRNFKVWDLGTCSMSLQEQKFLIAFILMVLVYAVSSFLSLTFKELSLSTKCCESVMKLWLCIILRVGTIVGDIVLWDVGTRERLIPWNFKEQIPHWSHSDGSCKWSFIVLVFDIHRNCIFLRSVARLL